MLRIITFLLSFFPLLIFSQNQLFNGKLTYSKIFIDVSTKTNRLSATEDVGTIKKDTTYREILIKDSFLLEKRSFGDGLLVSILEQEGSDIHLLNLIDFQKKIYHPYINPKMHDIVSREQTKETKYILGLLCCKYIYMVNDTKVTAWIPKNNAPYLKQRDYGGFFDVYFFPDGLAFEIEELFIEGSKKYMSITRLIKMEIFDLSKIDFDKFIEDAKNQPVNRQRYKF